MAENEHYQGWTNWETWHTALIADNEEALYNRGIAMAKAVQRYQRKGQYDPQRAAQGFKRALAPAWKRTREFLQSNARELGGQWAEEYRTMAQPNWLEIAEHFVESLD